MSIGPLPPNFANAISPFSPIGKQSVGEESKDTKSSTLKAVERSADSARTGKRRRHDISDEAIEPIWSELDQDASAQNKSMGDDEDHDEAEIEGIQTLVNDALVNESAPASASQTQVPFQPNYSLALQLRQAPTLEV